MSWLKEWHQQQWQQQPHQKLHQKTLVQGIYYRLLQNLFNIGFNNRSTTVFFIHSIESNAFLTIGTIHRTGH